MKRKTINLFVFGFAFIILAIAFLLRAQETLSHNFLFLIDQGRDMMTVKNIVFYHKFTLIGPYTSLSGVFQGPFYYYLLSIPTMIFDGDPWGAVLLMLLISLATVLVASFWMYKLFGKTAGIITLVLFSFAPQAIAASTFSWNPHPMWFLITVFLLSFYEVNRKNVKMSFLMWPAATLMFHFEMALGFYFFIGAILYFLLLNRKIIYNKLFLAGFFISLVFFIPQLLFDIRHDFLMTRSILTMLLGNNKSLFVKGENLSFSNLFRDHSDVHIEIFRSSFVSNAYVKWIPLAMLFLSLLSYFFIQGKTEIDKKKKQFITVVFPLFIIVFLLTMLYPFLLRSWFLTGFQVFYLLFAAIMLSLFWKLLSGKIVVSVLCIFMIGYSILRIQEVYTTHDYGGVAKIKGKQDALKFIASDAGDTPYGVLIFNPPVYTYAYDYLLWWNSYREKKSVPHSEKKGIVYLLIEPDPYKPWTYKGWLETVIVSGKILSEKKLPSGLIVQKRIF